MTTQPEFKDLLSDLAKLPNDPYEATLECADFIYKYRAALNGAFEGRK